MRFVTFDRGRGEERLGFVTAYGIADLEGASAARLSRSLPREKAYGLAAVLTPPEIIAFLDGWDISMGAAREALSYVNGEISRGKIPGGPSGEKIFYHSEEVVLKAPLPHPRKIICAGKNFLDSPDKTSSKRKEIPTLPVAFAKVPSVVVGPDSRIPYPEESATLDYEVEMAVVIGKPCRDISAENACSHIFGYTVFNDISARDVSNTEDDSGVFLLGKNLPGFAPMGPDLVTRDELEDPQALYVRCRVNGEIRQDSTFRMMVYKINEMIAYWSQIGLEPGDILTTGTPSGVAAGRKPGETPWWLKRGDLVEAEIEKIGILRSFIE
jgi:2-keto-4-pentenoate hydratase/2-oxohepta-3-ene-1,7-dioic acid hydratase in catechol pathway